MVQQVPADRHELLAFGCTTSVVAPVMDLVWGGIALAAGLRAASADDRTTWSGSEERSTATAAGIGWAAVAALSAGWGFVQTSQCRSAKDELSAQLSGAATPIDFTRPPPPDVNPEPCAPLRPALARSGTEVHAGPDPLTTVIVRLREEMAVCAGTETQGFGLRRVRLQDGAKGFVLEADLFR
jgi:hypothetical protein